jgi:hypothetical protein
MGFKPIAILKDNYYCLFILNYLYLISNSNQHGLICTSNSYHSFFRLAFIPHSYKKGH